MSLFKSGFRRAVSIGVTTSCLCAPHAVWADDAAPGAGAPAAEAELEEITVTAQRKTESIQQAPLAVTAITSQELKDLNLVSLDSIQLLTPGLVFDKGYDYSMRYIRGVGTTLPNPGLEGAVATYVDGAYQERTLGTVTDLFDASVQVLKGPQGTLWGRNASGGAIVVSTADPTNDTTADVTAEYGRFNHALGEAVLNVAINDTLAIRVGLRDSEEDGYITNLYGGPKLGGDRSDTARFKLRWAPVEDFSAVLGFEYDRSVNENTALTQRLPAPICLPCAVSGGAFQPVQGFYDTDDNVTTPFVSYSRGVNLRLHYDAQLLSVESTTAYVDQETTVVSDQDYSPLSLETFNAQNGGKTFTQEVLVSTNSGGVLNGLLGASYLDDRAYFDAGLSGGPGTPFAELFTALGQYPFTANQVNTQSSSVFLEGYLTPVEHLKITVGGRYTHDARDLFVVDNLAGSAIASSASLINQSESTSSHAFTPRVVFAYDLTPVNLYASWNRGYKAGGFSTPAFTTATAPLVNPEHIDSYEVGAKYVSDDRRVRVNAAAFYYVYKDIQVSVVENINGAATVFTENAASAKADGLELDGSFAVNDQLNLLAGGAYLHAYYSSFPDASVSVPSPTAEIPGGLAAGTENLTGTPLSRSPKFTSYVGGNLKEPVGKDWQANLNAIVHYSTDYDFYPGRGGPLGFDYQPAYTIVNLTANIGPASGRYTIGLYVNNLTNKEYYIQRETSQPFGAIDQVAAPRTYGVRLNAKF